jgi:hypothetical protein
MPYSARPIVLPDGAGPTRDSLGGYPFLPVGMEWPQCPKSGRPMVLFFQFDVRPEFAVDVPAGSHLLAFMSPEVNEVDGSERVAAGAPLPDRFWEKRLPHFKLFLFGPETPLVAYTMADQHLVHQRLEFESDEEPSDPFLCVGGAPRWYQDAEEHPGFHFLCQLSEDYPFPKQAAAPKQPDSFSSKAYCLFLGNSIYLFSRSEPRDPEEVWVVLQN